MKCWSSHILSAGLCMIYHYWMIYQRKFLLDFYMETCLSDFVEQIFSCTLAGGLIYYWFVFDCV